MLPLWSRSLTAGAVLALPLAAHAAEPTYAEALERYDDDMRRSSFGMRADGYARFAATGDVRALEVLAERYRNPELPEQQVRYLLADVCTRSLRGRTHAEAYERWLTACHAPADAWLWSRALRVLAEHRDLAAVLAFGPKNRDIHLRAAALEALARRATAPAAEAAFAIVPALPEKGLDRGVLLTSLGAVALSQKARLRDAAVGERVGFLIDQVAAKTTPEWAQLTLARQLSALLGIERATSRTDYLRSALEGKAAPPNPEAERYARPRFMGIEATGRRICYVIDLSDSMLIPLTAKELADLRRPVTPAPGGGGSPPPPEDPLPWDKIKTRFDAAREFLKLSLQGLSKDQSFAVVAFGSEASLLESSPGMRVATKAYTAAVVGELERTRPGSKTNDRPNGTLRGDTNLHAGFCRALQVKASGLFDEHEYVAELGYEQGCDTIFLLTDGFPTADDWPGTDTVPLGNWSDPETGVKHEHPTGEGPAHIVGPYAHQGTNLMNDIERLNLFRKAEIHCIGIGEANDGMLRALATLGLGRFRAIGR